MPGTALSPRSGPLNREGNDVPGIGVASVIRVMIVGDGGLFLGALAAILRAEEDIDLVAELPISSDVARLTMSPAPDVLVIDADVTKLEPARLVHALALRFPASGLIVLTAQPTPHALNRALAADVRGFISKDLGSADLIQMIRRVSVGQRVIDPLTAVAALNAATNPLTSREREVLRATAEGLAARQIAERLFLSHGTVRNHLSAILRKTGSQSRAEAVRRARDAGWL